MAIPDSTPYGVRNSRIPRRIRQQGRWCPQAVRSGTYCTRGRRRLTCGVVSRVMGWFHTPRVPEDHREPGPRCPGPEGEAMKTCAFLHWREAPPGAGRLGRGRTPWRIGTGHARREAPMGLQAGRQMRWCVRGIHAVAGSGAPCVDHSREWRVPIAPGFVVNGPGIIENQSRSRLFEDNFSRGAGCAREKRIAGPAGTGNCHLRAPPEHSGRRKTLEDGQRAIPSLHCQKGRRIGRFIRLRPSALGR